MAAADEALRRAMTLAQYEALARALEQHCAQASEGVLAEAQVLRERLHKKHKKDSQKLRRAHAVEMEVLSGIFSFQVCGDSGQGSRPLGAEGPVPQQQPQEACSG